MSKAFTVSQPWIQQTAAFEVRIVSVNCQIVEQVFCSPQLQTTWIPATLPAPCPMAPTTITSGCQHHCQLWSHITSTSCSIITSNVINNCYTNGVVPATLNSPQHPTIMYIFPHTHTHIPLIMSALSLGRIKIPYRTRMLVNSTSSLI